MLVCAFERENGYNVVIKKKTNRIVKAFYVPFYFSHFIYLAINQRSLFVGGQGGLVVDIVTYDLTKDSRLQSNRQYRDIPASCVHFKCTLFFLQNNFCFLGQISQIWWLAAIG